MSYETNDGFVKCTQSQYRTALHRKRYFTKPEKFSTSSPINFKFPMSQDDSACFIGDHPGFSL